MGAVRVGFVVARKQLTWRTFAIAGLLLIACCVFVSQFVMLPPYEVDDAWISFSYAKNLAAGHGLVFAHGVRTEGYSNFLWIVSLAPFLAVSPNMSPLLAARLLALPFGLLLAWSTFRIVERATGSRIAGALGLCLLATDSDLVFAAMSGLESFAYAAIITAGFAVYTSAQEEPRYAPYVIPVFVAAALTRIDGFIPLLFIVTWSGIEGLRARPPGWRSWLRLSLPGVIVYVVWFAWRWWYYGMPLPSTYYAKELITLVLPDRGQDYVVRELVTSRLWTAMLAVGVILWLRIRVLLSALAFVIVHLAYVVRVGGDWMPFGRFILPVLPLMVCLITAALFALFGVTEGQRLGYRGTAAAAGLGSALWIALALDHRIANSPSEQSKVDRAIDQIQHDRGYRAGARLLSIALPAGVRLVTDYPGTMAYYTDAYIIDMFGLATPMIAREGVTEGINPIFGRTCPPCYSRLDPEVFHVNVPIVRDRLAFANAQQVRDAIWQSDSIGRYLDFDHDFVVGRVVNEATGGAVYFLERRRATSHLEVRQPRPGFVVEYPFEFSR